jgi:hypothetical protein
LSIAGPSTYFFKVPSLTTVDDAEVDSLGATADLGRHALDFRGVNVEPFAKGFLQRLDAGDLGKKL